MFGKRGKWDAGDCVQRKTWEAGEADWLQITAMCGGNVRVKSRSWTRFSVSVLRGRCLLDNCFALTHRAISAGNAALWDTRPSLRWEYALAIPGAAGFLPASGSVC